MMINLRGCLAISAAAIVLSFAAYASITTIIGWL